jgi:putative tricarboxylic transport membrane protein
LLFCILGAYSLNQSVFDVLLMVLFGVLGYVFRKLDWPLAPTILALILGPMMERSLRTSLEMSGGDLWIFFQRPISAVLLIIGAIILLTSAIRLMPMWARKESKD